MTQRILATFVGGVFVPDAPLEMPENSRVCLICEPAELDVPAPVVPSTAWQAYIEHLRNSSFNSGSVWRGRDELYEKDF